VAASESPRTDDGSTSSDPFAWARSQARERLDELCPDPDDSARIASLELQLVRSRGVWNSVKHEVLGQDLASQLDGILRAREQAYYLHRLPTLFAFGYFLGSEITRMLGGNQAMSRQGGICAGLFNSFASLFDKVCDDYPELYAALVQTATRQAIHESVNSSSTGHWETCAASEPSVALRVIFRLMGAYFHRCRALVEAEDDKRLVDVWGESILAAYEGELASRHLLFGNNEGHEAIRSILFAKSVLPSRIILQTSIMTARDSDRSKIARWDEVAIKLGTAVWIVDDISDLHRDLRADRWNYLWLQLARDPAAAAYMPFNRFALTSRLSEALSVTGVVAAAASTVASSFSQSMEWLEENAAPGVSSFRHDFLSWLKSWVMA
jgi:hypothetical protein